MWRSSPKANDYSSSLGMLLQPFFLSVESLVATKAEDGEGVDLSGRDGDTCVNLGAGQTTCLGGGTSRVLDTNTNRPRSHCCCVLCNTCPDTYMIKFEGGLGNYNDWWIGRLAAPLPSVRLLGASTAPAQEATNAGSVYPLPTSNLRTQPLARYCINRYH